VGDYLGLGLQAVPARSVSVRARTRHKCGATAASFSFLWRLSTAKRRSLIFLKNINKI
jgi:hypothetical protein